MGRGGARGTRRTQTVFGNLIDLDVDVRVIRQLILKKSGVDCNELNWAGSRQTEHGMSLQVAYKAWNFLTK
jgi:hypothetical protein